MMARDYVKCAGCREWINAYEDDQVPVRQERHGRFTFTFYGHLCSDCQKATRTGRQIQNHQARKS